VEQAEFERARQMFAEQVRTRLGADPRIGSVELQQYGDAPEIEPGELSGKIFITVPAGADPDDMTVRREVSVAFAKRYRAELAELRKELGVTSFGMGLTEVNFPSTTQASSRGPVVHMKLKADRVRALLGAGGDQPMTAVMARLGRQDLETLDTLIAAGIAPSRAEAVRWALARIRERPAYEQLRARSREIEDLKSQF
jgi:hypothetical protein